MGAWPRRLLALLVGALIVVVAGAFAAVVYLGNTPRGSAASSLWTVRPSLTKTVDANGDGIFAASETVAKNASYPLVLTYRLSIFGGVPIGNLQLHVSALSDSTTSNIGTCQALVGTTVPANQTVTCTYTVSLSRPGNAALANTARLTYGPGSDFLTSSARVDFPSQTLSKSSSTTSVTAAGQVVPYSYVVTNTGTVTLTGIVLRDTNVDAPPSCPATTLAPGASMTCTARHTVTAREIAAGAVVNTGSVSSNEAADAKATLSIKVATSPPPTTTTPTTPTTTTTPPPPTTTTPTTTTSPPTATTTPGGGVDLAITKTASPSKLPAGKRVTFTERVVNRGPAAATNVVVIDPLPGSMTVVSASSTAGSCVKGPPVRCTVGRLAAGQSFVVTIVALTTQDGTFVNRARVTQDQTDTSPGDNVAQSTVTVAGPFKPPSVKPPSKPPTTTVNNGTGPHYTG
jgi:uncharacterized repeat protein (TIGR01451 family)